MENNPVLFEDEYVTQQLLSASIVEAAQVHNWLQSTGRRELDDVALERTHASRVQSEM